MTNTTYEQDYILYLINDDENTTSIIGNSLDSIKTRKYIFKIPKIIPIHSEEQINVKPKLNIFPRCFSKLFGKTNDNEQQTKCNYLDDLLQNNDNMQIESSTFQQQEQMRFSWYRVNNSVTKICENSFYFCKQIREIYCTESSQLQIIEKNAFSYSNLRYLQIPGSVTLQKGWCCDTGKLESILVSNNPRYSSISDKIIFGKSEIEKEEFDILVFCSRLIDDITIPYHIEVIGSNAFEYCKKLQHVSFSSQSMLRIIDDYSFYLSSIQSIIIPSGVTQLGKGCFAECKSLSNVSFSDQSKLEIIGEYAFSNSSIVEIEIPSSVVHICKYAFYSCKNLRKVSFQNNSKLQIDAGAFCYSSIKDILIPLGLTQIQDEVFSNCGNLQQVSIPPQITRIGGKAFANCCNLQKVSFAENSMLQVIDDYAFYSSSIQNFVVPSLVTQIGQDAFSCCSRLQINKFNKYNDYKQLKYNMQKIIMLPVEMK